MRLKADKPGPISRDKAEDIAAAALLFLAGDSPRISRFLTESGLDATTLSARAAEPEMLAAVLSHILSDESALLAFTANAGLQPEDVARSEIILGGGSPWQST